MNKQHCCIYIYIYMYSTETNYTAGTSFRHKKITLLKLISPCDGSTTLFVLKKKNILRQLIEEVFMYSDTQNNTLALFNKLVFLV